MASSINGKKVLSIFLILILISVLGWYGYDVLFRGNPTGLAYEVMEVRDVSEGATRSATAEVRLETPSPTIRELEQISLRVWEAQTEDWDYFNVHLYRPGMAVDGNAYAIAQFGPEGMADIVIIDDEGADLN
jgi:hypothetical protein